MKTTLLIALAVTALGLTTPLQAQEMRSAADWCGDTGRTRGARSCDVREYTLPAGALDVDAGPNGGVRVIGADRADTLVRARVETSGPTQAEADALAREVQVTTGQGKVGATGPTPSGRNRGWSVSYEIWVPRKADVSARTHNGGISMRDVAGTLRFDAVNGGVTLAAVSGDVRGRTVNGGVQVELTGARWEGAGLDAQTTNGGVSVTVPEGYSCHLSVSTVNGGVRTDFPITVSGRIDRRLDLPLGDGGAPVRIATTNGGVRLGR